MLWGQDIPRGFNRKSKFTNNFTVQDVYVDRVYSNIAYDVHGDIVNSSSLKYL
jgi:hypothetical protein